MGRFSSGPYGWVAIVMGKSMVVGFDVQIWWAGLWMGSDG